MNDKQILESIKADRKVYNYIHDPEKILATLDNCIALAERLLRSTTARE